MAAVMERLRLLAGGRPRLWRAALGLALAAFLLTFPFSGLASPPWLFISAIILVFAVGALGLNVLTGYTGQVSLGHAFFIAVGVYTGAVMGGANTAGGARGYGLSAWLWIPAAGVVAALCGLVIGPTALRLRGLYLAIVTIGVVFIGQHIWLNFPAVTGGAPGRALPSVRFGSFDFAKQQDIAGFTPSGGPSNTPYALMYYLALGILALAMLFVWNVSRTRLGRALQAVRERELVASLVGVDVARTKIAAFAISSFLAGVAGALYAPLIQYAQPNPQTWDLILSIQFVAIIIVGGIGTVWGAVLGSIFVGALPVALSDYADQVPGGFISTGTGSGVINAGDAAAVAYGLLIILFLVAEPRGVVGIAARIRRLVSRRLSPRPVAVTTSRTT